MATNKVLESSELASYESNLNDLEQFAKEEWSKIPEERCKKLIHGFRKQLISVMFSKGGATLIKLS